MTQTVLLYGKASQQRISPYIVISKRRLSTKAQVESPSENWFKPQTKKKKSKLEADGADDTFAYVSH